MYYKSWITWIIKWSCWILGNDMRSMTYGLQIKCIYLESVKSMQLPLSVVCSTGSFLSSKWKCLCRYSFHLARLSSEILKSLTSTIGTICVYIHACAALLVDTTHGSLTTPDISALRCSHNFLIYSADVVWGLFDSLDSVLFAQALSHCFWRTLLLYLGFIAWFMVFCQFSIICCL
jgi:hypothetical protein